MKTLLLACLFTGVSFAKGKSAEDYFHGSAYKYIAERRQEAAVEAEEGLRAHPGDKPLQSLSELLKKMEDQKRQDQNQEGGGQPDPDQEKKDGKDDKQEKDGKPEEKNEEKDKQDSSGKAEEKPPEKEEKQPDSSRGESRENPKPKPGQMSKEEAEQLLNSFADDEKKEQRKLRTPSKNRPQVEQDW